MKNKNGEIENIHEIINKFSELFQKFYSIKPVIGYPICIRLLKSLLKDHSKEAIMRVIELYFQNEKVEVHHLPSILSAYYMNKYLPKARLNPKLYSDADKLNEKIY